jgi:2-polyprenyl-3-methyl-5-hydroxy-6-metoxy-1,4-benzoquinol methylase
MEDDSTESVRRLYEVYNYPPPIYDIAQLEVAGGYLDCDPGLFSAQYWPEGRPKEALNILVAGCGCSQAARVAFSNPNCKVIGIDLADASLGYEKFLKDKHDLKNLSLIQLDLRELGRLRGAFDLIVCTGVLHHLANPDEGLRALAAALAPQGQMHLSVPGKAARAGVYFIQDALRRLNVQQDPDGIKFTRELIKMLPPHHYVHADLNKTSDVTSDAGLVEILLHPQDRAYSVPEVIAFVERCGLFFAGWKDNRLYYPDRSIPEDNPLWESLARISDRDQWAVIENLSLSITTHEFFACHSIRRENQISFDGRDWLNFVPSIHPGVSTFADGDRWKITRAGASITLNEAGRFFWAQVNGSRCITEILSHPSLAANSETDRTGSALNFYSRMWRLGYLFYSKIRPESP